jgi:hypothetical protein
VWPNPNRCLFRRLELDTTPRATTDWLFVLARSPFGVLRCNRFDARRASLIVEPLTLRKHQRRKRSKVTVVTHSKSNLPPVALAAVDLSPIQSLCSWLFAHRPTTKATDTIVLICRSGDRSAPSTAGKTPDCRGRTSSTRPRRTSSKTSGRIQISALAVPCPARNYRLAGRLPPA